MQAMKGRLEQLARRAKTLGVRMMIDAEQTYFQSAIDNIVLEMQQRLVEGCVCVCMCVCFFVVAGMGGGEGD